MFIVCGYNEDINDIFVTLSVQGQVFFLLFRPFRLMSSVWCDAVLVPVFWIVLAFQWFLRRVWTGEPPLSRFLDLSVEERQVFALIWSANGREKNNFPHFFFFFLGWRPFSSSTDEGQLTFSMDFSKNFLLFHKDWTFWFYSIEKIFVQLGCILFTWVLIIDTDCLSSTISVYKYYKWVYLTPIELREHCSKRSELTLPCWNSKRKIET